MSRAIPSKKTSLSIFRIALTLLVIGLFIYYFNSHKEEFKQLLKISPFFVLLILIGQLTIIASNVAILIVLVRLVGKSIDIKSATKVIAYSSIVNFFGFLQGGLGVRAWYLYKNQGISLKIYTAITILQYISVFGLAFLMIVLGLILNNELDAITVFVIAGVTILGILGFVWMVKRRLSGFGMFEKAYRQMAARKHLLLYLMIFSAIQLAGATLAFGSELTSIGTKYSIGSLLMYSGLAQFSILIALTPGALGIREGLLLAIKEKMMISSSAIIVSSTLDRLVYFITLGLLSPFYLQFRNKDKVSIDTKA